MQSAVIRLRVSAAWIGFSLVAAALASCGKGAVSPNGAAVDSVSIVPPSASVLVGSSVAFAAEAVDANGEVIPAVNFTWTTEDATIATVSQSGLVTGVRAGTVRIAASAWGKNAVATVTVNSALTVFPQVGRIVVAPNSPRIDEGETIQLTATVLDVADRVISGMTVTWSSSNTDRVTVDNTGLVRGIKDGNANVTASAGGKSGSTNVRVER